MRLAGRRGPDVTAAVRRGDAGLAVRPRAVARTQTGACGHGCCGCGPLTVLWKADAEVVVARVRQLGAECLFLKELTRAGDPVLDSRQGLEA